MRCTSPITINDRQFNCGHCMACRINYKRMWSLRLIYELSTNNSASFVTLTYKDEFLPENCSLIKKHLQDFFKRLRINLQREYHEFTPKIRYYACGEYGEKGGIVQSGIYSGQLIHRPHYHAIIYGLDNFNDKHREILRKSWNYCEPWFFDKDRGRQSGMQEVTPDDIQYVCGYIQKKLYGEMAQNEYEQKGKIAPFSVCSQGLGLDFCLQNKDRLIQNGWTYFNGHQVSLPRYFADKLGVKKSDYIQTNYNLHQFELENEEIFNLFKKDMEIMGINFDTLQQNSRMFEIRLKHWFEKKEYEYTNQVFKDFQQKQKLLNHNL